MFNNSTFLSLSICSPLLLLEYFLLYSLPCSSFGFCTDHLFSVCLFCDLLFAVFLGYFKGFGWVFFFHSGNKHSILLCYPMIYFIKQIQRCLECRTTEPLLQLCFLKITGKDNFHWSRLSDDAPQRSWQWGEQDRVNGYVLHQQVDLLCVSRFPGK